MLNFLKKFSQPQKEEVRINELDTWIESKLSEHKFNEDIEHFFSSIKEKKELLAEKILLLENAKISEKEKVELRVVSIVVGHKKNYLRELNFFLEKIKISDDAFGFSKELHALLDDLAKKTEKNYRASQHLFYEPVKAVFKVIGEINTLLKNFDNRAEKTGYHKLSKAKEQANLLKEEIQRKENVKKRIKEKEEEFEILTEKKNQKEQEITELKDGSVYKEYNSLKVQEGNFQSLVNDNNSEVITFLSTLGRALRKYEKIILNIGIVKAYLEDPIKAFNQDEKLKISDVIEEMGGSIEKGEVELQDKQKENALAQIKKARRFFKEHSEKGRDLHDQLKKVQDKLKGYAVETSLQIEESELKQSEEDIKESKVEIDELYASSKSFYQKKLEDEMKELVKEVFNVELSII